VRRLILAGAGHAHARVLLEFAQHSVANLEVLLVSPAALAPYSGMVPGWLAGHYRWEECCIDFAHLCDRAGASLRIDAAAGVDTSRSELALASGERLAYDWLSLDIGSTLTPPGSGRPNVLPMRPLAALHVRWQALRETVRQLGARATYRVLMIGGGAAGVESVLAAHQQLTQWAPQVRFQFVLATQGDTLVSSLAAGAGRRLDDHLNERGITVVRCFSAGRLEQGHVVGNQGNTLQADVVLWATGAQAYTWPGEAGLATDASGFIRVDAALRSVSHANIFAAGDCASWQPPLPKAGVFAVRMGPVLAYNLRAAIQGEPLQSYLPQQRYLVLIGTGGAHAVAAWGPWSWQGAWVWRWKQRIDRRFVARYNTL
jgi:pyridine nucleotide-disulfide oxidoreductase family protein